MRVEGFSIRNVLALVALAVLLTACGKPKPPVGKWEGGFDTPTTMIAARVEIGGDGLVRVSAPDLTGIETNDLSRRLAIQERLAEELQTAWGDVVPRTFDFDGDTFRNPGGVAPQLEWKNGQMTLVVYLGKDPSRHIPLRSVKVFSDNPFSQP